MAAKHKGILTVSSLSHYRAWLKRAQLFCCRCGGELNVGDSFRRTGKVLVFRNGSYLKRVPNDDCRFYHSECWDGIYIDV